MKLTRLSVFLLITLLFVLPAAAQKLKTEEIIAKHLDSIAKADVRAANKTRMIVGDVKIIFVSNKNQETVGRVVMASEGVKSLLGMTLNANDYQTEKFLYDGNKATIGFAYMNRYSPLGDFVQSNNGIVSQGLIGGALSTGWAPMQLTDGKGKFSGSSKKKIDGKEVYQLSYSVKGDADISLYFDAATFQHIRTEYKTMQSAPIGNRPEDSSRQNETRVKLVEDFSDFKEVKGLTLPHTYRLSYVNTGARGTTEIQWDMKLASFSVNDKLDEVTFKN